MAYCGQAEARHRLGSLAGHGEVPDSRHCGLGGGSLRLTCQVSPQGPKSEEVDLAPRTERTPFLRQRGVQREEKRFFHWREPQSPPLYTKGRFSCQTKPARCTKAYSRHSVSAVQ